MVQQLAPWPCRPKLAAALRVHLVKCGAKPGSSSLGKRRHGPVVLRQYPSAPHSCVSKGRQGGATQVTSVLTASPSQQPHRSHLPQLLFPAPSSLAHVAGRNLDAITGLEAEAHHREALVLRADRTDLAATSCIWRPPLAEMDIQATSILLRSALACAVLISGTICTAQRWASWPLSGTEAPAAAGHAYGAGAASNSRVKLQGGPMHVWHSRPAHAECGSKA
jgi:hypothetical protein